MPGPLKRILFSFSLILLAASMLLWSDRHNRHSATVSQSAANIPVPLAILQHSSNPLMDEVRAGVLQGLKAKGYSDGQNLAITTYNAEGDLPTGNLMAQKIAGGDYRLAMSISTVMLQALASANRAGKVVHVFGAVTSPVASGVGIKALDSLDKPPYLTGIGTPQPVKEIFRLAKQINPALKTVGVVWNPAEVNSEICTKQAREVSAELGIALLEAPVEHGKDVREAAASLAARGAEAFWTGGDATVIAVVDSLIEAAHAASIPVFSNVAGHAQRGALFAYGADYFEVGEKVGEIAGDILAGADPAKMPVSDFVPKRIVLNDKVRAEIAAQWNFPADLRTQAYSIIDGSGKEIVRAAPAGVPALPPGKHYKIGVAYFAPEPGIDSVMAGLREGLKTFGLEDGRNLTFRSLHAQAEIAQIPAIGQTLDNSDADAILTLTTPVLQGVGMSARHKPVVFTYVSDPLAAGAGKSLTEHLPNLTGIGSFPPIEDLLAATQSVLPGLRSVGTLYNPSEANSVKVAEVLRELCRKAGLTLEEVPINTTAEAVQAAQALVARKAGAIVSVGDNTMYQALDAIAKIAKNAAIPLVLDQPEFIDHDALMVVGVDYKESGRAAAEPLAQVLAGANPATIPLRNVSKKSVLLNEASAKRLGIVFPQALRNAAAPTQPVTAAPSAAPLSHRWKIKRLLYVESAPAEEALRGIDEGFKAAGLVKNRDFTLSDASAQGDMITLSTLADAVNSDGTELLMTLSTPTLQTALHKVTSIPIIFTFVANPAVAGAGTDQQRFSPKITGVYTEAPFAEMVDMLARYFPQVRKIGTLFTPVEDNSVHNKDVFVQAAEQRGISVDTLPVNSPGELPDAALAMASRPVDAWVQTLDNQTVAGFSVIAQAAARARKPLFSFTADAVAQGAIAAYTMDYYQSGFDAALKAAEVMHGKSPADIPFSRPSNIRLIVSENNAKSVGWIVPAELLQKAEKR